jgi:hypothetical protein
MWKFSRGQGQNGLPMSFWNAPFPARLLEEQSQGHQAAKDQLAESALADVVGFVPL